MTEGTGKESHGENGGNRGNGKHPVPPAIPVIYCASCSRTKGTTLVPYSSMLFINFS